MVIAFTGHRKIEGQYFDPNNLKGHWYEVWIKTVATVHRLWQEGYKIFISGGALGFDQLAALAVIYNRNHNLDIQLHMALPFPGFEGKWPHRSRKQLADIMIQADKVFYTSPAGYAPWKMFKRNEAMVDLANKVVALYLPDKTGGTLSCISYAMKHNKPLITINPLTRDTTTCEFNTATNEYVITNTTTVEGGGT